jgi:hypothetical protein
VTTRQRFIWRTLVTLWGTAVRWPILIPLLRPCWRILWRVLLIVLLAAPVAAQGQRIPLQRIGPNAGRTLAVGEVGWLIGTGDPVCVGATLTEEGRSPSLTTWRVVPQGVAWQCTDGVVTIGVWGVWMPILQSPTPNQ